MKNTTKRNSITAKFVTNTRVELDFGGDIAVVNTPNSVSARMLAAMVEANLVDLCGDNLHPCTAKTSPEPGARLTTEQRHGIRLIISDRINNRELVRAEDLEQENALN
jgi:predicted transglutaminase-like cysteine proteinase